MKKLLFALSVVLLLAAGCSSNQALVENQSTTPPTTTPTQQPNTQTSNLKTYSNAKYHFALNYPSGWVVTENNDYISVKPTSNSRSSLIINTVNVGRESVFDPGTKVKIQDTTFAGKKAKMYDCKQSGNVCPNQLAASVAIHLTELPTGWGQGNEIDYDIYNSDNVNVKDFQDALSSIKFTK